MTVAGGGVHGAGALFESYVIAQDSERAPFQKRMLENGVLQHFALERGDGFV